MAIRRRVRIQRMRTPSGMRCYKILKNGQRRFVKCPKGTRGFGKRQGSKKRKKSRSRRRKGCSCK